MSLKRIVSSSDFLLSTVITVILLLFLDISFFAKNSEEIAKVGITIFSIVFPLFFTSFSIIITSNNDEFAKYLKDMGFYELLIGSFKFTLYLNFFALIASVAMKFYGLNIEHYDCSDMIINLLYIFLCLYALFATFSAVLNSIEYAKYRGIFYSQKNN